MAKRKRKVSLFEAVADDADMAFKTPAWIQPGSQPTAPTAERTQEPLKKPPGLDVHPTPTTSAAQPLARAAQPILSATEGQLHLRLNYVTGVAICLAMVVLLGVAYTLGRKSAAVGGVDIAGPGPLIGGADAGDTTYNFVAAQTEATRLCPTGGSLLVIQDYVASMDDAKAIQRYLRSRGYTPLVHQEPDRIAIISTKNVTNMADRELQRSREALTTIGRDEQWELRAKYDFSASYVHTSQQ